MDNRTNHILDEADSLYEYTRNFRREFHRHPELGFEEIWSSRQIESELKKLDIDVKSGVGKTGITGLIDGNHPGPVILLRFDMDALPVQEENEVDYASEIPGKMHACGHDGHMAIGLTTARILANHREELHGRVKLMFQPAEEGLGGAEAMIAGGVLENPRPDLALSLHIWNEKPFGWIGVVPGPLMAASDIFKIRIKGKGGHGAFPDQVVDPVVTAAQIISGLQTLVSRNVSPLKSAVVSVTRVAGGETFNVIPPFVDLQGTIRTFENDIRQSVIERMGEIINGIASSMRCQADLDVKMLTPAVINDQSTAERLKSIFQRPFPDDYIETSYKTMGSEDMAFVLREIPGCYFLVGSANADQGLDYGHHNPRFNFDERVLPKASALMALAAASYLTHDISN